MESRPGLNTATVRGGISLQLDIWFLLAALV
jgi:hypothetical protein